MDAKEILRAVNQITYTGNRWVLFVKFKDGQLKMHTNTGLKTMEEMIKEGIQQYCIDHSIPKESK